VAVDFSTVLYLHAQDMFGREIIITPVNSSPGSPAYTLRGIWTTRPIEILTDVGMAVLADQETIVDIRDNEFLDAGYAIPSQGDLVQIPADNGIPDEGTYEITKTEINGGGETTLVVRKWMVAAP
jgi:hypothetical protein